MKKFLEIRGYAKDGRPLMYLMTANHKQQAMALGSDEDCGKIEGFEECHHFHRTWVNGSVNDAAERSRKFFGKDA